MHPYYLFALELAARARRNAATLEAGSIARRWETEWAFDFLAVARKLRLAGVNR